VQLFHSAACDASGNGQGATFLTEVVVGTDGAGNATFNTTIANPLTTGVITATATNNSTGNTSEFSQCKAVAGAALPPDLSVTKSGPASINVGATFAYTIVVTNTGGSNATGVVVTDALPAQVTFVSATSTQGTCSGTTTVTCTASDARGNTGFARFEVVVKDATAPVLTLPDTITTEATSSAGADVTYTATATDLVDGARDTSCSPASGATFAVGSTTVTCTATDASGNAGSGTFLVNVVDTTAPTLTVPGPVVVANATSPLGAAVSYTATATDSVAGDVAPTCSAASGSVFAIGGTTVTCTATDSHGNTSAAQTFTVEVKGAVEQLSDQLQVVTSWKIPGHLVEIRTKGPLWSLTQAKPKVNLACQLIRDFESQLGGTLGQTLTATQREWVLDQLTRIYAVIGCVTPA